MSSDHPYRRFRIPPSAPIELKPSPGKGWGVFATRDINTNGLVLREEPLFVIDKMSWDISDVVVHAAVAQLPADKREQFMSIRANGEGSFPGMQFAFFMDSAGVLLDEEGSEGFGVFVLSSRFNFSCFPNARTAPPGVKGPKVVLAARDIAAGEEITVMADKNFMAWTSAERRLVLGFDCDCRACAPGTAYRAVSDMRRRLIRGVYFLLTGVDKGPWEWDFKYPVPDLRLRKVSEMLALPIHTKVAYGLLLLVLLEREGLLYDDMSNYATAVMEGAALFSVSGDEICDVILNAKAGETKEEKFAKEVKKCGQPHARDEELAALSRKSMHGPNGRIDTISSIGLPRY